MNAKRFINMWGAAILGVLLFLSTPYTAIATSFSFLPRGDFGGIGNKGTGISKTKGGLTLSLTALTGLTNAGTNITGFRTTSGSEVPGTGTIVIDGPDKNSRVRGMGVQDIRPGGSTGISGGGPLGPSL